MIQISILHLFLARNVHRVIQTKQQKLTDSSRQHIKKLVSVVA